ncbi:type VI secretion system baseplate subunit TssF [Roseateles noduli]|uniref:type VI secretion system baseplate subunit TssF n=1 Tax=Roseateles noduli TaxID=2052484 RepID=UPI003D66118A
MHPRLLQYYNQELRYLRDLGQEFAEAHPKVAGQLGLGASAQDPYIERLLEGSAFLAARVQLKLDAEFPRLSHRLLDMVYPGFNAPLPSMLVARVQPAPDPQLLTGYRLPRGTALHGAATTLTSTRCEFRTAQDTVLTPVSVAEARLVREHAALDAVGGLPGERPRAALVLSLRLPDGQRFDQLGVDRLRFFLTGAPDVAASLAELTLSRCVAVLAGAPGRLQLLPASSVSPVGYADDEALLPAPPRAFAGLRILQETLAFPERFQFFEVDALSTAFSRVAGPVLELVLALTQADDAPLGAVSAANVLTNCLPAINLFPCRADRLLPGSDRHEFHVVVDRSRPLDHEVYAVTAMTAHDAEGGSRRFEPLHGTARIGAGPVRRVYSTRREPRPPSERVRQEGGRSSYAGTEVFLSWSDGWEAEAGSEIGGAAPDARSTPAAVQPLPDQVALDVLCTNRDLPLFLRGGHAPLTLDAGIALTEVRAVAGPSRPLPAPAESSAAWRLLNLLSLNYLSLMDTGADAQDGSNGSAAGALRELLSQLPQAGDADVSRQIGALTGLSTAVVHRRHPAPGPIAYARGVEISLTLDEQRLGAGSGHSAYLLGAALHQFLSRHVSLNSFVETVLLSTTRGEIGRWAPRVGARPLL